MSASTIVSTTNAVRSTSTAKLRMRLEPIGESARQGLRHRTLQDFHVGGGSSLGVALLERSTSAECWEVHYGGDELLFFVQGSILVESRHPTGAHDWKTITTGQCILIKQGAAHAVSALEDTAVLFITPREGSQMWQEAS